MEHLTRERSHLHILSYCPELGLLLPLLKLVQLEVDSCGVEGALEGLSKRGLEVSQEIDLELEEPILSLKRPRDLHSEFDVVVVVMGVQVDDPRLLVMLVDLSFEAQPLEIVDLREWGFNPGDPPLVSFIRIKLVRGAMPL